MLLNAYSRPSFSYELREQPASNYDAEFYHAIRFDQKCTTTN